MPDVRTHSLGVMCAECKTILVADQCSCGNPHGYGYQTPKEWAARMWPDHPCFVPHGYQYGVRFQDGSVAAYWNGRTQRQRASEYLDKVIADQRAWIAKCGSNREPDNLVLVRRLPGGEWEEVTNGD